MKLWNETGTKRGLYAYSVILLSQAETNKQQKSATYLWQIEKKYESSKSKNIKYYHVCMGLQTNIKKLMKNKIAKIPIELKATEMRKEMENINIH